LNRPIANLRSLSYVLWAGLLMLRFSILVSADEGKAPEAQKAGGGRVAIKPDEKAEKKALASLGEGFQIKRTQHYSILYNTGEEDIKTFSLAIERTYASCARYSDKLGVPIKAPDRKLIIYYFEHHKDYSAYSEKLGAGPREQSTPGVYLPELNVSMFYNFRNVDSLKKAKDQAEGKIRQLRDQLKGAKSAGERQRIGKEIAAARRTTTATDATGGDLSEAIVQHEVAPQVLWNIGFHNPRKFECNPRWLAEGTAMMFETISKGKSANIGAVNKMRLDEFRELVKQKKLIPLREFISTPAYFGPQTIGIAYPESWALVHYLNRVKRKELAQYVARLNQRTKKFKPTPEGEIKLFEEVFGPLDAKWIRKWEAWMAKVN
jgi:hypothetical protein